MRTSKGDRWSVKKTLVWSAVILFGGILAWKIPTDTYLALWHGAVRVFIIVLLATILTYILRPGVKTLQQCHVGRWRISRWLATLLMFSVLLVVGGVLLHFTMAPIIVEIAELGRSLDKWMEELPARVDSFLAFYAEQLPPSVRAFIDAQIRQWATEGNILEKLTRGAYRTFGGLALLLELLFIPFLTFFFLTGGPSLHREFLLLLPPPKHEAIEVALARVDETIDRYLRGLVLVCFIAAVLVTTGLAVLRIKFSLLLGLFAGLTRAIPTIGPIFGGIPIVLVVLLTDRGLKVLMAVLTFYVALHLAESKIIMPNIIGHELELHPAVVILALLVGEAFFGILGMFLAAPVVAVVRTFLVQYRAQTAMREAA